MIEVVSLLGVSYTGKSTLAEGLVPRLADEGIIADVIKKDAAMKTLGQERYGEKDATGGYSIVGFLKDGQIPSSDLHNWMNEQVQLSQTQGHVAILEGGTRTRAAQAETLSGVELDPDGLMIFMLQLPFSEVLSRARERRREQGRYDDHLPVALGKLFGQYRGLRYSDAPKPEDADVTILDASMRTVELVEITASLIFESRAV